MNKKAQSVIGIAIFCMELFGKKSEYFLGIDFGTSAIKIVEIEYKNEQAILSNYGQIDLGFDLREGGASFASRRESLRDTLTQLLAQMRPKTEVCSVALPGYDGLVTVLEFPRMNYEEIDQAIHLEAQKHIPLPLSEVATSWDIVGASKDSFFSEKQEAGQDAESYDQKKELDVLLVAAPKKEVESYEQIVSDCGLRVGVIELEAFSAARALIGSDPGLFLLIDVGARATNIVLIDNGMVRVNRNIDVGGDRITQYIAESSGISIEEAEARKINPTTSLISMAGYVFDFILSEARIIIEHVNTQLPGKVIDQVVLSGGSAKIAGLDEYCSQSLGIPVVIGDPWKGVVYGDNLLSVVQEIGSSFSVAIGLALRGIEERNKPKKMEILKKETWIDEVRKKINAPFKKKKK